MAFITQGSTVLSFADYDDALRIDQRVFEENEGLTADEVEDALIRSTERVLDIIRTTNWYRTLAFSQGASMYTIPALEANKIVGRRNDFTDLGVYYALYNYILPKIADFGTEENSERVKISYYQEKFSALMDELISDGSWYDYNGNGTVTNNEFQPGVINYQRVR